MFRKEIHMNKLMAFAVISAIFISGCAKKDKKDAKAKQSKFLAQDDTREVPIYTEESEALLADATVSDFAFVDDEDAFVDEASIEHEKVAMADSLENDLADEALPMAPEAMNESSDLLVSLDSEVDWDFENVQFGFNKNNVNKDQLETIKSNVLQAKKAVEQGKEVVVSGHTCQIGSATYNLALSQKRAEAVKKELIKEGVPSDSIKTIGKGYESPLVWTNATDRATKIKELSVNRRAEIVVN